MKKIAIALLSVGLLLVAAFLLRFPQKKIEDKQDTRLRQNGYLQFISLPEGVLARSGDLQVLDKDLNDPALNSYYLEQIELFMALSYKELIAQEDISGEAIYSVPPLKRPVKDIFNQYGVVIQERISIALEDSKEKDISVRIKGKSYGFNDFDKKDYRWGAIETKIFQRKLFLVEENLRNRALTNRAQELGVSTQDFIEESIEKDPKLQKLSKENQLRTYVKNELLELPVQVDLREPQFVLELKPDWTPSIGKSDFPTRVMLFSDFFSEPSRNLLSQLPQLAKQHPQVYFGFRPLFPRKDRFQRMLAEFGFCVWVHSPDQYWSFLEKAVHSQQKSFEKDLYQSAEEVGVDLQKSKQCFFKQEHKKVVDYHIGYGEYLSMWAGPVVFVAGEVLTGGVTVEMITQVLQRKVQ